MGFENAKDTLNMNISKVPDVGRQAELDLEIRLA